MGDCVGTSSSSLVANSVRRLLFQQIFTQFKWLATENHCNWRMGSAHDSEADAANGAEDRRRAQWRCVPTAFSYDSGGVPPARQSRPSAGQTQVPDYVRDAIYLLISGQGCPTRDGGPHMHDFNQSFTRACERPQPVTISTPKPSPPGITSRLIAVSMTPRRTWRTTF